MRSLLPLFCLLGGGLPLAWTLAVDEPTASPVAVETLLPSSSFMVMTCDGTAAHMPALKETAAWKALEETELTARLLDLVQMFISATGEENGLLAREAIEHLRTHGMSLAGSASGSGEGLSPYGVLVIHQAGNYLERLQPLIEEAARSNGEEIEQKTIEGREVAFIGTNVDDVEVSWWNESGHLVMGVGLRASEQIIATATGKTDNISKNPRWAELRKSDRYKVDTLAWVDMGSLMDQFGDKSLPPEPSGEAFTVRELATLLGVHNIRELTMQAGYEGTQTWNDTRLKADGPLTGLAALLKQRPLALSELPPMPKNTSGFAAATFDLVQAIDVSVDTIRAVVQKVNPAEEQGLDDGIAQMHAVYGGDPKTEFIAGLGDVWCVFADPAALPIPIGFSPVVAVSVKDKEMVASGVERLIDLLQQPGNPNFTIRKSSKDGRDFFSFNLSGMPIVPTVMITEKWLVGSITPGSVQSLAQREIGKLPSWKPTEQIDAALKELPSTYNSITISDPAPTYQQALQFAPMGLGLLEQNVLPALGGAVEMPFGVEDLPAVEMVTEPMFPNITVGYSTDNGIGSTTRQSVPSNPMGNVSATVALPVMVALLLPAVQQAREAARRTQSKNNLKMIGLAMHNYHDTHNELPRGTVPNEDLKPEERLSWAYSILPFLEQAALYNELDGKVGWEAEENTFGLQTAVPFFQNPSQPGPRPNPSSGDYVAMAGVGEDAATLKADDPKAGIFGYDRQVRFRDITDGTTNTIMVTDSSKPNASYLAGGKATIRGFSKSPYLNGPDGIGSPHNGIVQVLFADGSVRAISVNTDETVLEALATKAGGEEVGEF